MSSPSQNESSRSFFRTLYEVALYFVSLGLIAFRGSAYAISRMERDLIGRWVSVESFENAKLTFERLPTPLVFQLVVWTGFERGRATELPRLIAALSAIFYLLPFLIVILIASALIPSFSNSDLLLGANAAVFGVLVATLLRAMRVARESLPGPASTIPKQRLAWWIFVIFGFFLSLLRPSIEIGAILVCGFLSLSPSRLKFRSVATLGGAAALVGVSSWTIHETLLLSGIKTGALMFGGGLAALPLLGGEFVDQLQWFTYSQFLETLAINRAVSAPLMMTIVSIGYKAGGISAAILATAAVFLVPFLHVVTWYARKPGLRRFPIWEEFSFGATAAILGAVVASILKLLEPIVLAGFEVEGLGSARKVATLALWILIPALSYFAFQKKQRPAWAVILGGALLSLLTMSWI